MTYHKDPDITYNQMAMYIDENIYSEEPDIELIYQYMYHIIYMLAKHNRYFKYNDDYDKFSLYMSTQIYLRYQNKDQYVLDDSGNPKLEKVKSVMNYIKQTIGVYKIRFQNKEFSQNITHEEYEFDIDYSFDNVLQTYIDNLNCSEFTMTLNDVGKTCRKFLSSIPYKQNSKMWLNIYLSVMMTFLNRMTLKQPHIERLKTLTDRVKCKNYHIMDIYDELDMEKPILYHLPEHMSNYIDVLCRQLKHLVGKDLSEIYHTNISTDLTFYKYNYEGVEETYEDIGSC